jgi:SLT domain-containing protein
MTQGGPSRTNRGSPKGWKQTDETKARIAEGRRKYWQTPEGQAQRERMREAWREAARKVREER